MGKRVKKQPDGWRMTPAERRNYYLGGFAEYMGGSIMTTFYSIYMMFQGVDLTKIAVLMFVVKCIDAVDDVILGFLLDKIDLSKSKLFGKLAGKGKYLPWYRAFCWVFPLATIAFFCMPTTLSETAKMVWFFVGYVLYDLTYTLIQIPKGSMIMTVTDSIDERAQLVQNGTVISTIGGVVLSVGWPMLISESVGFSVSSVAIVSMILMFLFMLPLAVKGKEHNVNMENIDEKETEKYTFRDMLECIKVNKEFGIILLADLVVAITSTASALNNFIAFYRFNDSMALTWPTLIALVPTLIVMTQMNRIIRKIGKRACMIMFQSIVCVSYVVMYFIPGTQVAVCISIMSLMYMFGVLRSSLVGFLIPDTIEYTKYKTGKDCAGIFNAMNSFVNKATTSFSSSLGMFLLGLSGWVTINATDFADLAAQNVVQPESALNMLWSLNTLIPAAGVLAAVVIMIAYRLKESDVQLMADCNAGRITKEECEQKLSRKY